MLTAAIITKNECDRIEKALESVSFADEKLVLDCGSVDETASIAAGMGAKVVHTDWPGHVAQKNRALSMAAGDWVLHIDADEEISPELASEIRAAITNDSMAVAYRFPRENWWMGAVVRHGKWGKDRPIRLLKKGCGKWGGKDPHDRFLPQGRVNTLKNKLVHRPYRNLGEHLSTIDRYSAIAAKAAAENGLNARYADLVFRPIHYFISDYFFHRGFLDGSRGLCLAWLGAVHVLLKWWRLRELQRATS